MEPTQRIKPGRSIRLETYIGSIYLAAFFTVLGLSFSILVKGALLLIIVICLIYSIRTHVQRCGWTGLKLVDYDAVGGWTLYRDEGVVENGTLHPSSFVHPRLVVLNFRINRFGCCSMVLTPDAVDHTTLRRLRARLRINGGLT